MAPLALRKILVPLSDAEWSRVRALSAATGTSTGYLARAGLLAAASVDAISEAMLARIELGAGDAGAPLPGQTTLDELATEAPPRKRSPRRSEPRQVPPTGGKAAKSANR